MRPPPPHPSTPPPHPPTPLNPPTAPTAQVEGESDGVIYQHDGRRSPSPKKYNLDEI